MNLSMIIATDMNGGIGRNDALPWPHDKEDMRWFVRHTKGKVVVMGRRTWESLPFRPLLERTNIVVTSGFFDDADVCINAGGTAEELVGTLKIIAEGREVMVIGGAKLYETLWPFVTKLYYTRFEQVYPCDTFFHVENALAKSPHRWHTAQKSAWSGVSYTVLEAIVTNPPKGVSHV